MKRFITPAAIATAFAMAAFVGVVTTANRGVERSIEQAVRYNVAAAGLLSKLQVQAERMRRFEKEMFIYAAAPDKRAKYVKEFDDAHVKLLDLQNQAMATKHRGFSEEDRAAIAKWSEATAFYANEFRKVAGAAESAVTPEQKADLTVRLNNDIGPGKDRFREVLDGASKMREAKEKASLEINQQIDADFARLNMLLAGMGIAISVGGVFAFSRRKEPAAARRAAFNKDARLSSQAA